jgi:hypothetical protein
LSSQKLAKRLRKPVKEKERLKKVNEISDCLAENQEAEEADFWDKLRELSKKGRKRRRRRSSSDLDPTSSSSSSEEDEQNDYIYATDYYGSSDEEQVAKKKKPKMEEGESLEEFGSDEENPLDLFD